MKQTEKAIKLTQELVQTDSSDPGAYEGNISKYIEKWMHENLKHAEIERDPVLAGRDNLRAVFPGRITHPALIFICHMDTVVLGDGWQSSRPLSGEIKEGRLYGRGSCDMKSGLACAMSAMEDAEKLICMGKQPERTIMLIATADEEDFMRGAEKAIASGWVTGEDWILDGEPTNGEIRMAHKGRTWFEVSVKGITAHASTPHKGADAIAGMAEIICGIRKEIQEAPQHEELGRSTVTFGMIEGGYRPYVVPDTAKVWIDMRLVPPITEKKAREIVQRAIQKGEQCVPGIKGSWRITGSRPYIESNRESVLLKRLCEAVEKTEGTPAPISVFPGYTDTAVIAGMLHNKNCMSYGPGNLELAHKPDEFVELADIWRCRRVFGELISQCFAITDDKESKNVIY